MSLVTIYACIAMKLGLHLQPENFLPLVVGIAGAVAGPVTILAFFREHQKYAARLTLLDFATTDPLTGVLNRRSFQDAVADEQLRMARSGKSAAILLLDLDHFKKLNDAHGHVVGDKVLKAVSYVAHSELRGPFDRLGRWGGEEFIILLNEVSLMQAMAVAERLRERIQSELFEIENSCVGVTASFGVTLFGAHCAFENAVSLADNALYQAKSSGRNSVVMNSPLDLAA